MSLDSNTHPLDELAVYALDALEPNERAVVEEHLAVCASCRAELDRHLETLAELSTPEAPPAHVWDRIAEEISGTGRVRREPGPAPRASGEAGGDVLPFAPPAPDPDIPRHRAPRRRGGDRTPWLAGLAAAAAAAAIVGAGVIALRGDDSKGSVEDLAVAAADNPDSQVVTLVGDDGSAEARVVVAEDGAGYVLLDDLPTLPEGRAYQLWKTQDSAAPVSLGVLGNGSAPAAAVALPAGTTNFAVTDEPADGVPAPTGPTVARSA